MATMNMTSAPQDKSETAKTTNTKTTTTSSSPRNGLANEDIDTALFGSLNASMADTLTDRIDTALKTGVATLPLMNDTSTRSEKLLSALRNVYWRNVDVFEVYSGRNIFSVGMYPPKRRRAIEQLYNNDNDNDNDNSHDNPETSPLATKKSKTPLQDVSASKMNETANDTTNNNNKSKPFSGSTANANNKVYPTTDQIPTAQQMADMTAETDGLREQLWQAQRRLSETVQAMNQLEVAEQLVDMASSTMQESTSNGDGGGGIEQVHDSVTAAVVGSEGLEQLQATGKELVEKLEQEKRQRSDGDDPENDDDFERLVATKKKKEWTLEERYQEELKSFSNPTSLSNVQRMIQE